MKTTVDLNDRLLIDAKKFAAEKRTTLRKLIEHGLRDQISGSGKRNRRAPRIRWIAAKGGLPEGMDISSREDMMRMLVRPK